MNNKNKNEFNMAIVYLRAIAIVLIVYHHSIAIFQGWPPVDIGVKVPSFFSISGYYAKFFGLYAFTLISGYLVGRFPSRNSYAIFLIYKAKKILVPLFIAAFVYYMLFPNYMISGDPINGTHLWYLPMIYVLYMLRPILKDNISYRNSILLIIIYIGLWGCYRICNWRFLIESFYYMGAFVLGAYLARIDDWAIACNKKYIVLGFVITILLDTFVSAFITINILVLLLYLFLKHQTCPPPPKNKVLLNIFAMISRSSMLIYISHQFIINFLVNIYLAFYFSLLWLPILSFGMSLIIPTVACVYYDKLKKRFVNNSVE